MRHDERTQVRQVLSRHLNDCHGTLPTAIARGVADAFNISLRSVHREAKAVREAREAASESAVVADADAGEGHPDQQADSADAVDDTGVAAPPARPWWTDEEAMEAVLARIGASPDVKKGWSDLRADGAVSCSYSAFTRQLRQHLSPAVHAGLTARGSDKGRTAYIKAGLYNVDAVADRNARWQADCQEIPMRVRPSVGTLPVRPWQITFIDEATRMVMGTIITEGRPTGDDVLAALATAIRGSVNHHGEWVGGIPQVIRWDNGREFMNAAVTRACARLGIAAQPSRPYSGWQKGKIERWHRTIQDDLYANQPGALHGPKSFTGDRPWVGDDADLLSIESLVLLAKEWVYAYNHDHVHRSLGMTPIEKWRENTAPVQAAAPQLLHPLMLRLPRKRKVNKNGISYDTLQYLAPELAAWRGRYVDVRVLPHVEDVISVFDPKTDEHICDAVSAERLTPDQRRRVIAQRNEDYNAIRRAINAGTELREQQALVDAIRAAEEAGTDPAAAAARVLAENDHGTPANPVVQADEEPTTHRAPRKRRQPTTRPPAPADAAAELTPDANLFAELMEDDD